VTKPFGGPQKRFGRKRRQPVEVTQSPLVCTVCEKELPAAEFSLDDQSRTGRKKACRPCEARMQALRHASRKHLAEACEVCGGASNLVADHDHRREVFRGTLCVRCNTALGMVRDSVDHLRKLILYLQRPVDSAGIAGARETPA
jgi:hypothetical protein